MFFRIAFITFLAVSSQVNGEGIDIDQQRAFEILDIDVDGKLSWDEFLVIPRQQFKHLDADGDGFIQRSETPSGYGLENPLAKRQFALNPRQNDAFDTLDVSKDGKISWNEFLAIPRAQVKFLDMNGDGFIQLSELPVHYRNADPYCGTRPCVLGCESFGCVCHDGGFMCNEP